MDILLIEDNKNDVLIFKKALKDSCSNSKLNVSEDGNIAIDFLNKSGSYRNAHRPDLIILDLKLPGIDGIEVLKFMKSDSRLKRIPVVVLTDSDSAKDITEAYNLYANCFIIKPRDCNLFMKYVVSIDNFWSGTVSIPNS